MKTRQSGKDPKQASQYDKILKENLEAAIPALIKNVLGIEAVTTEEIPDDPKRRPGPNTLKSVSRMP